jgi:hypothetical protein
VKGRIECNAQEVELFYWYCVNLESVLACCQSFEAS